MICVPYICFLYFHSAAQIVCWIVSGTLQMCRWLVFITGVGVSCEIILLERRQSHVHVSTSLIQEILTLPKSLIQGRDHKKPLFDFVKMY